MLCFLPGAGEIARVAGLLAGVPVEVLQLHGRAPAAVQDAALAPGARRRVLLATSVAESSLTVPGVRVVVDCGLAREPRTDHARGLGALTTVRASRATAAQRAGRAGREAPGHGLPMLVGGRARPAARHAHARDRPRRPHRLRAAGRLLGRPRRHRPGPARPAAARRDGRRPRDPARRWAPSDAAGPRRPPAAAGWPRLGLHPRLARALLDGAARSGPPRRRRSSPCSREEPPRRATATTWRARLAPAPPRAVTCYAAPARWRRRPRRLDGALRATATPARPDARRRGRRARTRPATTPWPGWWWRWRSPNGWPGGAGGGRT